MKTKDKIFIMLYLLMASIIAWMYCKFEENNDNTELLEIKTKITDIITNDSLNTIKLQAQILASDSIINTLNERNKKNESEIKRLKGIIVTYDYTSSELPEL